MIVHAASELRAARGPLAVVAAIVIGVIVGDHLVPSDGAGALLVAAAGAGSGTIALRSRTRRRRWLASGAALLSVAGVATALTLRAHHGLLDTPLRAAAEAGVQGDLHGTLASDPVRERFGTRALVRVDAIHPTPGAVRSRSARIRGDRTVLVRAGGDAGMRLGILSAGDRLVLRGDLEPLDGWDTRFADDHAAVRFRARSLIAFSGPTDPLRRSANALRSALLRTTSALGPRERGLFASFLIGDTTLLTHAVVEQFRAAGLSHLLVVSGANVAFVLSLFGPILRRIGLASRLVLTGGVLAVFGSMTRFEPSVTRAIVMAALVTIATTMGRGVRPLRVLALAVAILLVVDPFLLHSVGFGLSVGASAGIALLGGPLAARLPGPRPIRDAFGVTVAAQIGVLPILLAVFGSVPLVGVPANLLAVPVAEPLTVIGLLATILATVLGPWVPGAVPVVLLPVRIALGWILTVAEVAARTPFSLDRRAVVGISVLGLVASALRARRRRDLAR